MRKLKIIFELMQTNKLMARIAKRFDIYYNTADII